MIELTEVQRCELSEPEPAAIDSLTRQVYILVRKEMYERLKEGLPYDDSPWTDEEMDLLAQEGAILLDEYRP